MILIQIKIIIKFLQKNENLSIKSNLEIKNIQDKTDEVEGSIPLKERQLDNFELNNLEYEEALMYDKRSFLQIY